MIGAVLLLALAAHGVSACFRGWEEYNGYCYSFSDEELTWFDAGANCFYDGAYLVQVDGKLKNDWLISRIKEKGLSNVWMGGTSRFHRGNWEWLPSHKSFLNYQNWGPGEPNGASNEFCAEFHKGHNYKWNDRSCSDRNRFICERKA